MQDERDAPLLRISATTGTTEQLHSGRVRRWPLKVTDFKLSSTEPAENGLTGNTIGTEKGKKTG